jgi:hypothetical protein
MLFSSNAKVSASVLDSNTTGRKYHESWKILSSTLGGSAVAPAGGCIVSVRAMTTTVVAHEIDAESQRSWSKRSCEGRRWKSLTTQVPISAPMKCPPTSARGCANGDSMEPFTSTADAPCGKHMKQLLGPSAYRAKEKQCTHVTGN